MNKKFISHLMNYIDHCQEKLQKFEKNNPDWEDMDEDQRIELITRETEVSSLKWIRDKYFECIENED